DIFKYLNGKIIKYEFPAVIVFAKVAYNVRARAHTHSPLPVFLSQVCPVFDLRNFSKNVQVSSQKMEKICG
ncbi:hypothetical protein, partial [Candidatus Methanomassiliicoccus intestinalis]|uniref:hypothetical protein n=1 Tax=Candidatus Methanomassiliicoccus intestinalis TaxID=1406512 RepID=UPI0037DCF13B